MKYKLPLVGLLLFIVFGLYRIHFWDYQLAVHLPLNAFADVSISLACGALIYVIVKKFKTWIFSVLAMLFLLLGSVSLYGIHYFIYSATGSMGADFAPMFHALCFQLLDSAAIVLIGALSYLLLVYLNEKEGVEQSLIEMSRAKEQEELKYLKTKINPHFIFNGLNTIYHEVDTNTEHAKNRILQFSEIVRYHLRYASFEKVNFKTECQYLQAYIDFNYNSTMDFIDLKQHIEMQDEKVEIAPLLLLPFVENAFKYCSAKGDQKAQMNVNISLNKESVDLDLHNTYDPEKRKSIKGTKIGIANALKRLEHYYTNRYELTILDEAGVYQCNLKIAL